MIRPEIVDKMLAIVEEAKSEMSRKVQLYQRDLSIKPNPEISSARASELDSYRALLSVLEANINKFSSVIEEGMIAQMEKMDKNEVKKEQKELTRHLINSGKADATIYNKR